MKSLVGPWPLQEQQPSNQLRWYTHARVNVSLPVQGGSTLRSSHESKPPTADTRACIDAPSADTHACIDAFINPR